MTYFLLRESPKKPLRLILKVLWWKNFMIFVVLEYCQNVSVIRFMLLLNVCKIRARTQKSHLLFDPFNLRLSHTSSSTNFELEVRVGWFLYDRDLRHERVNPLIHFKPVLPFYTCWKHSIISCLIFSRGRSKEHWLKIG